MDATVLIINIIFLILSSLLIYPSVKRIVKYQSFSMADYVIILIAVFNCIPVFFDIAFGVPMYVYWYKPFESVICDFNVCVIYNFYVLITLIALQLYARSIRHKRGIQATYEGVCLSPYRKPIVDVALSVLPVSYFIYKYGIAAFAGYTMLGRRGIQSGDSQLINQMIILSIYIFATRFFSRPRNKREYIGMFIFFFLLIWLNGKRYMIVTIGEVVFYLYQMTKRRSEKRASLTPIIIIGVLGFVLFSAFYITSIKVNTASQYLYGTLRVDFGRDDVTKYVIHKVLIKHEPILDYPGQTVLADILIFVPRSIWPGKPYPHYRYLTASILGVSTTKIPAGTTPSIFEMNICNFGWMGIIATMIVLIILCNTADKANELSIKVIILLIITNLLSQALDAVMVLLPVAVVLIISRKVRFTAHHSIKG